MRIPRRFAASVVFAAWLMFIISFFLPATDGGTNARTPLTGWQAFASLVLVGHPLVLITYPNAVLFIVFPFINLAMLLAPVIVLAWSVESWHLSIVFMLFGIAPWFIPKEFTGDLFVGFYIWDASFIAMAIGCILVSLSRRFRLPDISLTSK